MRRLNWEAPQSLYDLEFIQDVYTEEFLERIKLVFGASYSTAWWGVVDEEEPATAQISDSRPLVVKANATQPLTIDVLAGIAVTQTGERIVLTTLQSQRTLADTGSGAVNVVYLRSTETADKYKLTQYDINVPSRYNTADDDDLLQVSTLSDYLAMSTVTREKDVVLAVVTVQPLVAGGYELSVDMTQNSYTWNRPWFSPVDIAHRTRVGTGITTDNNPHGLQINDMVAGGLTLWQLILDYGIIVAEDQDYAKVAGALCTQVIPGGSVLVDTTGAITGLTNAQYVELLYYPEKIVRITDNTTDAMELAGQMVPGTRILYFTQGELYTDGTTLQSQDMRVRYTWVQTGHPTLTTPQMSLEVINPVSRETMVAGGLQIVDLDDETLEFADAGGIPKYYKAMVDASKTVRKLPQVIFCTKKLDDVGAALEPFVISPWGPATLRVALTGATSPAPITLQVEIRVHGKDITGATISEDFLFDSTWIDNLPGATDEEPQQFLTGTQVFDEVTNWQVLNRVDDGPNSAIMMWLDLNPVDTEVMADILPLFECFWDGTQILRMLDIRPVNTIAEEPTQSPLNAVVQTHKDSIETVVTLTETNTKLVTTDAYVVEIPSIATGWVYSLFGVAERQRVWTRTDRYNPSTEHLIIPFGQIMPPTCTLISLSTGYWLNNVGAGIPTFQPTTFSQNTISGVRTVIMGAAGGGGGFPTPAPQPPIATPWTIPAYHIIFTGSEAINQSINEYFIVIEYDDGGAVSIGAYPAISTTAVTWQKDTVGFPTFAWTYRELFVEDFRRPQWVDGTQSTMSKDIDGLGPRDTYVSRPIPLIYGGTGARRRLRFVLFGAEDPSAVTWEYRWALATGAWAAWTPLSGEGPHDAETINTLRKVQFRVNPNGDLESSSLGVGIIHWTRAF